jgi:hypothetical protein
MPLSLARGVTLVELLVALVLFGATGTLLLRASLGLTHALRAVQARASAQATLDQGSSWLAAELGELGPGDLRELSADGLRYRRHHFAGTACAVSATEAAVRLQRGALGRAPQAGRDSLLLLVDTLWTVFPVLAVGAASCDGESAVRIGTSVDTLTLEQLRGVPQVPARLFEAMQARFYSSGGAWWLGGRSESAGEGLQPLAGPFRATGASWTGRDSLGTPTADPSRVHSLHVELADSSAADSAALYLSTQNGSR